jgi:signal peptidase
MKATKHTIFRAGAVALFIALLAPFVVFIAPQVAGAEHSYVVISGSMAPAIGAGDTVVVNNVSGAAIHDGDIITFRRGQTAEIRQGQAGENLVTHRVVDIVQSESGVKFKTKGDANEEADQGLIPADALVGRVMLTIPYIGHVIAFAGTQLGLIALVALPLGLLVAGELYDLARAARNSREASDVPDEQAETDGGTAADEWVAADELTDETESEER